MTTQEMRITLEKQLEKFPFFISTKETASFLGISKSSVIKKTESGEIKSIRNGKLIKIPKECLIEYVLNAM
ncbi:helix-turn-helix domain-containing protein [Fusobacterium animalis]|uniref:helix-turn-helix domain-containing protein n=1 Tax=Fusobacterium animalis TaxID=76859 RepID=UPI0030CCD6EE